MAPQEHEEYRACLVFDKDSSGAAKDRTYALVVSPLRTHSLLSTRISASVAADLAAPRLRLIAGARRYTSSYFSINQDISYVSRPCDSMANDLTFRRCVTEGHIHIKTTITIPKIRQSRALPLAKARVTRPMSGRIEGSGLPVSVFFPTHL